MTEAGPSKDEKRMSLEDVKKSNKKLIVIQNKVYDVTEFMEVHPGGKQILMEQCGKDVTNMFNSVGHSKEALKLLETLQIGIIVR